MLWYILQIKGEVPGHATKAYVGSEFMETALILDVGTSCMRVGSFAPRPL